jgi:hypothetical protein
LCHTYLGLTAKDSGRERAAELHLAEAIELLAPVHDVAILGIAIAALAAVEARRAPRRALVLAAAAAARDRAGGRYTARAQADIDAVRAAGEAALGPDRAAAAWGEGSRLLFDEASALALRRSPQRKTAPPGGLTRREPRERRDDASAFESVEGCGAGAGIARGGAGLDHRGWPRRADLEPVAG